jgi:hypothetical protein
VRDDTIVCIGTGPSLTVDQVQAARARGFRLFVCNAAFKVALDAELLYAVNLEWWDHYHAEVLDLPCEKWTTNRAAADKYGLNWIEERGADGLSTRPDYIHHGHGSGYSLVSMAHRKGAARVLLLGYDLRYAPDYDGRRRVAGSTPRHSELVLERGEYPAPMQHWPSVHVRDGVHLELLRLYRSIHDQGLIEIVCCSPGSALEGVIPCAEIAEC